MCNNVATTRSPAQSEVHRTVAVQPAPTPVPPPGPASVSESVIDHAAEALRANNVEVLVVDTGDQARAEVLRRIPAGSEVYSGKSKTLEDIGVFAALHEPGRFDPIRPKLLAMDRAFRRRHRPWS